VVPPTIALTVAVPMASLRLGVPFSVSVLLIVERQSRPCHDLTKTPSAGALLAVGVIRRYAHHCGT
jgi:hypothetical protein